MSKTTLRISQGDHFIFEEEITGTDSLEGYTARLYIATKQGTLIGSVNGTINGLIATFTGLRNVTRSYRTGTHKFETKYWDSSNHLTTLSSGPFIIDPVIENNPN